MEKVITKITVIGEQYKINGIFNKIIESYFKLRMQDFKCTVLNMLYKDQSQMEVLLEFIDKIQ